MATGAPGTNGVWQYGEDDSEATFSALLNKVAGTADTQIGSDRARLTTLELSGRVLQVVQGKTATQKSISALNTETDTGLTATITPRYSNSKILVLVQQMIETVSLTNSFNSYVNILRGSSYIHFTSQTANAGIGAGGALAIQHSLFMEMLDEPATTSAVTYKTNCALTNGYRIDLQYPGAYSVMTLIEIKA